jgi:antitoxin (DNA-binding transcriptional repressor) of toxin-antitoxin stability system
VNTRNCTISIKGFLSSQYACNKTLYFIKRNHLQIVTLNEAQNHLVDLVEAAAAGEEIFIKKNDDVTLQLVPHVAKRRKRQFGSAKGLISMATNFDEPLEDFREYSE